MSLDFRQSCDRWFLVQHELDPSLPEGFPSPELRDRDLLDTFRVGPEGWTGYMPPEDSALAPDLNWTEAHRILVLAAYVSKRGKFLQEGETYEVVWPPEGYLSTEGHVLRSWVCPEHEADEDCSECDFVEEVVTDIVPACWSWSVRMEKWVTNENSDSMEDGFEWFHFLTILMDPRDVEYRS